MISKIIFIWERKKNLNIEALKFENFSVHVYIFIELFY